MSGRANMVLTGDAIAPPGKKKLDGLRVAEPSAGLPTFFADHPGLRACNEVRLGQQTLDRPRSSSRGRSSSRKTENLRLEAFMS